MTRTKGNVIVEDIKIGDIHYEFEFGCGSEVQVVELPKRDDSGYWSWKSKNTKTGNVIEYGVHEDYSYYGPNLYDYKAYIVENWV